MLEARRARWRVRLGAALVLVLVGLGAVVLVATLGDHGTTGEVAPGVPGADTDSVAAAPSSGLPLYVHVLGAVPRPGLYVLHEGDRIVDAVAAAGGFTDDADRGALNLARLLADGEQLIVPVAGATPVAAPGTTASGTVNLNTADAATLDMLPRVGPAMATRIIDYREANGPFTALEDLLGVTGIGDKTLEGLRGLVSW